MQRILLIVSALTLFLAACDKENAKPDARFDYTRDTTRYYVDAFLSDYWIEPEKMEAITFSDSASLYNGIYENYSNNRVFPYLLTNSETIDTNIHIEFSGDSLLHEADTMISNNGETFGFHANSLHIFTVVRSNGVRITWKPLNDTAKVVVHLGNGYNPPRIATIKQYANRWIDSLSQTRFLFKPD